jgi:hypothetical protein
MPGPCKCSTNQCGGCANQSGNTNGRPKYGSQLLRPSRPAGAAASPGRVYGRAGLYAASSKSSWRRGRTGLAGLELPYLCHLRQWNMPVLPRLLVNLLVRLC